MNLADLLQGGSLVAVAVALVLTARQNRHLGAQTRQAIRQSALAGDSLAQTGHHSLVDQITHNTTALIGTDPELCAWFLGSRGFPPASADSNKRYFLLFTRLDSHEAIYLSHVDRSIGHEVWLGWRTVMELDAATPEFAEIWPAAKVSYSPRFAEYVDGVLAQQRSTAVPPLASQP